MIQQEYMTRFKEGLKKVFSEKEVNDIIQDYKEYFRSAIADGVKEEDVCESLGNPEYLASSIINETNNMKKSNFMKKTFFIKGIAIFLITAGILCLMLEWRDIIYSPNFNNIKIILDFFFIVSIPALAFYIFDGGQYIKGIKIIHNYKKLLILCWLPIIAGLIYYLCNNGYEYIEANFNSGIFGPILMANIIFIRTFFFCLACVAFVYGLKHKTDLISLTYPCLGMVMMTVSLSKRLKNMADPLSVLYMLIISPLFWIMLSVGLMFVSIIILRFLYPAKERL